MTNYLLEVGIEELPSGFIENAQNQLEEGMKKLLEEERITFDNIKSFSTPRRLAVIVENISLSQPDLEKEVKGPPANIAFDGQGNLTKAGEGFLKKLNLSEENAEKRQIEGIDYLFAKACEKGKETASVLSEKIPEVISKIQGSRFMRWADLDEKFSRPIRWIVSILDDKEVKVKFADVESGAYSRGHRFVENKEVKITSSSTYIQDLYEAKVIVDNKKRRDEIIKQAKSAVVTSNGEVKLDENLLDEVCNIVEWPVAVLGRFDEKYLEIPEDVVVTVMASHQRYFPVYSREGKLLNAFITMANYEGNLENIKNGNERVIKARLDDAIFFYNEDIKKPLTQRVEDLKGITFQKGLATVYEKTQRVRELSAFIGRELYLDKETLEKVDRTALLAKTDLTTNLVFEFTELEGVIGGEYARISGEDELVYEGVREHYLPKSAERVLPETITGQIVGIADKIDTITGVFALGKIPTGSADPLGLRRAAIGVVLTVMGQNIAVDIDSVIDKAIELLPIEIDDKKELKEKIYEFIMQRLRGYLLEDYRYDIVEAILGVGCPLKNLNDVKERLGIMSDLVKSENYGSFHESVNRISRIIKGKEVDADIRPSLFELEAETLLANCLKNIKEDNYSMLVESLKASISAIEKFFEDVLVMAEDEEVKRNRLSLLTGMNKKFLKLADFSKIVY